jgi:hypothetical protein
MNGVYHQDSIRLYGLVPELQGNFLPWPSSKRLHIFEPFVHIHVGEMSLLSEDPVS